MILQSNEPEPFVEWIWIGRILEKTAEGAYVPVPGVIYDTGYTYQANAEDFMEEQLKEYSQTHKGEFATSIERMGMMRGLGG